MSTRRTSIVITGAGVVSAAGTTREAFHAALAEGRSGVADDGKVGLVARVGDFGAKAAIEAKALRRLARMSQMALVAAKQALAQAAAGAAPERTGIILGTGLGTLRETIDFMKGYLDGGPEAASPLLFPSSVMNAAAGQMALELGLRGPNSTVNHREASPLAALLLAADLLALGRADVLLAGGVEEASEPVHHGYRRFGALTTTAMRPYARGRDGTVLGEGAALFVLEREADARARGATILARLAGWAQASEVRPRVGAGADWQAAAGTVRAALADAALPPSSVGWVCGAGCGVRADALEARAVAAGLDGATPPYGSILGQTGECFASGAFRVAAALYALGRQALPGTVGAGDLDPDAPIADLVTAPRPTARVDAVLIPSLAQGGANTALVLGTPSAS